MDAPLEQVSQPRVDQPAEAVADPAGDLGWEHDPVPETSCGGAPLDMIFPAGKMMSVRLGFGELFATERKRPIREGWGYTVELPAVVDLLQKIEDGQVAAADARDLLLQAADVLYDPFRCWEAEDPGELRAACAQTGGCSLCEQHRGWFEALLEGADERWRRLQNPRDYPFAVGRQGIHTTSCAVVGRESPDHYARPTGDAYTRALNAYSHTVDPHSDRDEFEGSSAYPRFEALTTQEAHAWIATRTGPKGGRNFKRCRRCAPAL
ncbi:hypothetical protein [Streptomyces lydicus]|uniref:hypothetical protein n=1 Tax=Streptomyces lydicus TaxID=47763 RepID=UPI0010126A08|nr:hypothetical protein [Streptomyces lydicus]MCZ1011906.1 hypothetical protein [Streptomyces lydicus]